MFGIDLEPNRVDDRLQGVLIDNCTFDGNVGGGSVVEAAVGNAIQVTSQVGNAIGQVGNAIQATVRSTLPRGRTIRRSGTTNIKRVAHHSDAEARRGSG